MQILTALEIVAEASTRGSRTEAADAFEVHMLRDMADQLSRLADAIEKRVTPERSAK